MTLIRRIFPLLSILDNIERINRETNTDIITLYGEWCLSNPEKMKEIKQKIKRYKSESSTDTKILI